jgi:ABC-type uncharacterized transport system involved in gliding motility auxiliary subunit
VANSIPAAKQYADRVVELLYQYRDASDKVSLEILEPRPDTEIEQAAIKYGIQGMQLNIGPEPFYFGLAIENEIGESQAISFLDINREGFLEYDISQLIAAVSNPQKKVIGIMSALPVSGGYGSDPMARFSGRPPAEPWLFIQELRRSYDVKDVELTATSIDPAINLLIVIHPKGIKPETEYAIDQFLLRGGRAIVMVDPMSHMDQRAFASPNPQDRFQASFDSNLPTLLPAWGIEMVANKIAGDLNIATRMQTPQGPAEYPDILDLRETNMNQNDITSGNLERMILADAGILKKAENAKYEMVPLLETTNAAAELDAFLIKFGADPNSLRKEFKPGTTKLTLAWKVTGAFDTAFPAGKPAPSAPPDPNNPTPPSEGGPVEHKAKAENPTSVIVISDSDMAADDFSVRKQQILGQVLAMALNDNLNFMNNAVENQLGATQLINLRTRGRSTRPFTRVDELEQAAQAKWKAEEDRLNASLEETRQKLQSLQAGQGEGGRAVLTASQVQEIENFRAQELETKRRLIEVRRNLRQDIEALGTRLKLINIALVPGLIFLLSFLPVAWRSFRMRSTQS